MKKILIIEPHADDSILGCFTQLFNEYSVDIITVSSGKPEEVIRREKAIQEVIKHYRRFKDTQHFFFKEGDRKLNNPHLTLERIQGIIDMKKYDAIFYAEKEGCHPLHDELYDLMQFVDTKGAKCYLYPAYGKWTFDKIHTIFINKITPKPLGFGYIPKLKGKHMIHKLTKEESDEKWKAMFMYRLIAEEDYIRMNLYEVESCKRVK